MKIFVTGGTSMIGHFLLPMLVRDGHEVFALSRGDPPALEGVCWIKGDLCDPESINLYENVDVWINLTLISLLPDALAILLKRVHVNRVIAFSSTSRFTKVHSNTEFERNIVSSLIDGESKLSEVCEYHNVLWTVFRPTLIYCLGRDKSLTLVADKIRRFRFFPLLGRGRGLRQPVHAEDLAIACVQALYSHKVNNKAYNLSGGEVLSYRLMVERLFDSQHIRPRFIRVPTILFSLLIKVMRVLPKYRYLTVDMADRMQLDMVFSHADASDDFDYAPRTFHP